MTAILLMIPRTGKIMDSFCTFYYSACGAASAFIDILFALMNIALNLTCVTGFVLTHQLITMLMVSV